MKFKEGQKKFWNLLWKDDSLKGWIFSIVFLVVFFKFIFLPGLGLITGTSLPLAIVESCSMYHDGNIFNNFDGWWENHDGKYSKYEIEKEEFENFIFKKGFSKGDILFIIKANPEKLKVGDVILFNSGTNQNPIIHRIISIEQKDGKYFFNTIGDNNNGILTSDNNPGKVDEKNIKEEQLVGKAVGRIVPYVGWGKLIFYEHLRTEQEKGLCYEN